MSSSVIKIEEIYKEYRLGTIGYGTLREDMQTWWASVRGKPDPNTIIGEDNQSQNFPSSRVLALKNINLDVKQGERVGIIGKNGAGKTTLLKILSRISSPSDGIVKIKGRVASLLGVGSGFHGELTGRDNIYLNGAILGLNKLEIDDRYEQIVNFSGVGKFIDTPVKRYSSGMYVRLGFAVAAHLDPDILIVDEVLAVGDAGFQRKALGKMKSENTSINKKRTILFVSHNMELIKQLCDRVVLLDSGEIIADGTPSNIIDQYLEESFNSSSNTRIWDDINNAPGNALVRLLSIKALDSQGQPIANIKTDQDFVIEIGYFVFKPGGFFSVGIDFMDLNETIIFGSNKFYNNLGIEEEKPAGKYIDKCLIPANLLSPGKYTVSICLKSCSGKSNIYIPNHKILMLSIAQPNSEPFLNYNGVIKPKLKWNTEYEKNANVL